MSKPKILVVDDTEINRQVALLMLEDFELDIDVAVDGQDAFDKAVTGRYGLIFMDCLMPVMDGFASTRAIRAHNDAKVSQVPIVALTASVTADCKQRCVEAGMNEYIAKPFTQEILSELIERYLKSESIDASQNNAGLTEDGMQEPAFDLAQVKKLQKILGARFQQFVLNYFAEVETTFEKLKQAKKDSQGADMERLVHSMKSGAANFGGHKMSQFAQQVEDRYRERNFDDSEQEIVKLENLYGELKAGLSTLVDE